MKPTTRTKTLVGFNRLGVKTKDGPEGQAVGTCPFCGASEKFYINAGNLLWDCKVCSRSGNFGTFLKEISEIMDADPKRLKKLADNRGLNVKTLKAWNVKTHGADFLVPVPSLSGKSFDDLRTYRIGGKVQAIGGGSIGLVGIDKLKKDGPIYLIEGEWDALALHEAGCKGSILSTSAGILKDSWSEIFMGRDVVLVYDNDRAGEVGTQKAINRLTGVARSLARVEWPSGLPDGYDFRDMYIKLGAKALERLEALTVPVSEGKPETVPSGPGLKASTVKKHYKKWLDLQDDRVIDLMFGALFANRIEGDPVWIFMISPPSGGKSELLMSLERAPLTKFVSSFTPKALVSGTNIQGMVEPSLIDKLDGKVGIIKDFTTILSMNPNIKEEILSTFRDAYDGRSDKIFGTNEKNLKSSFGLLCGVTGAIERELRFSTALGERFLRWRLSGPKSESAIVGMIERALANGSHEKNMREELAETAEKCASKTTDDVPEVPRRFVTRIIGLARFVAEVRVCIQRERYTNEIIVKPEPELGMRIAKQLQKLGRGIAIFQDKKKIDEEIYRILVKVARDSCPRRTELVIEYLARRGNPATTSEIGEAVRLPAETVGYLVRDLAYLGIISDKGGAGRARLYGISDRVERIMKPLEIYRKGVRT